MENQIDNQPQQQQQPQESAPAPIPHAAPAEEQLSTEPLSELNELQILQIQAMEGRFG